MFNIFLDIEFYVVVSRLNS